MRSPALHRSLLLLVMIQLAGVGARAWADDPRAEARTHYQAGQKLYSAGDYKSAIREFSAAQQIMPADLNNYNLALCYDKLGDAEPAVQYYKEYLNKVPNADKRSEIEASIARLDAALKSAQAKKAEEQKKLDDARKAEDAKKAADEDARRADDAKKAEELRRADDAKKAAAGSAGGAIVTGPVVPSGTGMGAASGAGAGTDTRAAGAGAIGTPSTGTTVSTGDAQLDRVAAVDVNAIRDQRLGGAGSGLPDNHAGPAMGTGATGAGAAATGTIPPPAPASSGSHTGAGQAVAGPNDKPAQEPPVYKKWWFWVVVGVSAYVLYEIANDNSTNRNMARELPVNGKPAAAQPGGLTLFRW
jgi:hypothetical protein